MAAQPPGTAVAAEIKAVHIVMLTDEILGEEVVAAAMLTQAVHDQHVGARLLGRGTAPVKQSAVRRFEDHDCTYFSMA